MGPTSAGAVASAIVPLIGSPQAVIYLQGRTTQSFTFTGNGTFVAAITAAGNSQLFINPGDGQ